MSEGEKMNAHETLTGTMRIVAVRAVRSRIVMTAAIGVAAILPQPEGVGLAVGVAFDGGGEVADLRSVGVVVVESGWRVTKAPTDPGVHPT